MTLDSLLTLASKSPRRSALLRAAGIDFEVRVADIDESHAPGDDPRKLVMKTARAKADRVAGELAPDALLLAADTIVVKDGRIFNKPDDREDARAILRELSGVQHSVFTGLTLCRAGGAELSDVDEAIVTFRALQDSQIECYLASGEADDKAGAYGIQVAGPRFVASVNGDLTCVIGLPLGLLREMMSRFDHANPLSGRNLREITVRAFPALAGMDPQCLAGIPDH
jgi:septum formation protein